MLASLIVPAVQSAFKKFPTGEVRRKLAATGLRLASFTLRITMGACPTPSNDGSWHRLIYPYLKIDSPDTQAWGKEQWQENIQKEKYYICPSDQTPYSDMLSYAWNKN